MLTVDNSPPPVAVAELKSFLRIEDGREDALLAGLLRAATETVEAMLGQLLFERSVEESGTVTHQRFRLSAEPVRTVTEVLQVDDDGELISLAEDRWRLNPGRHGTATIDVVDCPDGSEIVVRYRAGVAANWNWVPEVLRLSVVRAAAHFHARRDSTDDPGIPPSVRRMLAPWRTRRVL